MTEKQLNKLRHNIRDLVIEIKNFQSRGDIKYYSDSFNKELNDIKVKCVNFFNELINVDGEKKILMEDSQNNMVSK
jgi:hypothetical protein